MSTRITEKDALVSTWIKFVMIRTVIMNKRNTTKDFGRIEKGFLPRNNISKGDSPFENMRGNPIQKICGSKSCICPKKLRDIHLEH